MITLSSPLMTPSTITEVGNLVCMMVSMSEAFRQTQQSFFWLILLYVREEFQENGVVVLKVVQQSSSLHFRFSTYLSHKLEFSCSQTTQWLARALFWHVAIVALRSYSRFIDKNILVVDGFVISYWITPGLHFGWATAWKNSMKPQKIFEFMLSFLWVSRMGEKID